MWRVLLLLLPLGACNTPGPYFHDVPPARVTVDGSVFDIRIRDGLGEAIRVNPQYAPRLGPIAGRAKRAFEQVSGCDVVEIHGDQSLIIGTLACDGAPAPTLKGRFHEVECYAVDSYTSAATGEFITDLDCDVTSY